MMRAVLLCLAVTLVQAGTLTETSKCEDEHDIYPADDWVTWAHRLHLLGECGKTIADNLDTLVGEISSGGDWARTRVRLDEIVEKTSKVIFHARLLFGPMLTMPSNYGFTFCAALVNLAEKKGSAASTSERHTAILHDAECFAFLVQEAFVFKWLDPRYDKSQHSALFLEAVKYLKRLKHDGDEFHQSLTKLTGGIVRKSSDSDDHTDELSDDLKSNFLERLIKALNSKS
ncbi:uncharacterized protein [Haliotis asinina]|uniref:uncharacterized protein n=1 Tax=Haliotis asinina TaxID=109174 RepID=UPI00353222B8